MSRNDNRQKQRSLRFLVSWAVGVASVCFLVVFAYVFLANMLQMLEENEKQNAAQQTDLLADMLAAEFQQLRSDTYELSTWSDISAMPGAFPRNRAGFIVVSHKNGDIAAKSYFDLPHGDEAYAAKLLASVEKLYPGRADCVFIDGLPYMVYKTLLRSDALETGSTIVMGQALTDQALDGLLGPSGGEITLLPPGSPEVGNIFPGAAAADETRLVIENRAETAFFYRHILTDMPGGGVILKMEKERTLFSTGVAFIIKTGFTMLSAMLLFAFILYYLLERSLLRPMAKLSADVQSVSLSAASFDFSRYSGVKELALLGGAISDMLSRLTQSREQAEQSKISLNVLKSILNGLDAYLYVSDRETDEILFINDKMIEHFGLDKNAAGQICWKVLQAGYEKRCDFCPNYLLDEDPDAPVVWEEHNTVTGRYYRNTDTLIEWSGGKMAHLQNSVDITEIKLAEAALKKRLQQQELMSEISQSFIENEDMSAFITKALRVTGEFIGCSRIMIRSYSESDGCLRLEYVWTNHAAAALAMHPSAIAFAPGAPMYDAMLEGSFGTFAVPDVEHDGRFSLEHKAGICSFLMIPIFVSGDFWGMLELDDCEQIRAWSDSDIHLGNLIGNFLSGVITRQELSKSVKLMSSIVESSPQYITFTGSNGKFSYVNPAAAEISGYSRGELMEGGVDILFSRDYLDEIYSNLLPATFREGRKEFELPLVRKGGEERILLFSSFTVESSMGAAAIATDVTEQRRLERELILAKEQAEAASKAKGEFLSRMTHEMRTPMNAIIGMTNIARSSGDFEKMEYCLGKIDNASRHLLGVINDILDMSKIEANKFELTPAEFELEKMLINIANVISFRAEEKNLEFIVNIGGDVPRRVFGDELRLAQVITNLLSNATKFTPEGGKILLQVENEKTEGRRHTLRIAVVDSGIGISPEQQGRLFNPFEQADGGIARKYGGTGLGLAISKRIVEMMGGNIWVESELGSGAQFIFTVQVDRCENQPELQCRPAGRDNLRVLAVDDSAETREYFLYMMDTLGIACDVAEDGRQCLEMLEANTAAPYDVIFVDWQMPGINGIELTRRIRQHAGIDAVVIMISVAEWSEIEKEAVEAGVNRFVPKPLFPSALVDSIHECLGGGAVRDARVKSRVEGESQKYRGFRLLLAEDVEINREILCTILEDTGLEIECAVNGREALEMFQADPGRYHMIMMDIQMPEMDGLEATRLIRALPAEEARTVPIVAMTANVFREDIENCLAAGMDSHLGKPVNVDELFGKLNQYLR